MPASFIEQNNLQDLARKTLENVRKKLLDLTARNKLLNFKETAKTIRIVDELPNQVFDMLVHKSVSMEILAYEPPKEEEEDLAEVTIEEPQKSEASNKLDGNNSEILEKLSKGYGLESDQVAFIIGKVKKLGSIEAVTRIYDNSSKTSTFAKDYAARLFAVETSIPPASETSEDTSVEGDAQKYGLKVSQASYIRGKVEMLGSVAAAQEAYPGEKNNCKYAVDYASRFFSEEFASSNTSVKETAEEKKQAAIDLNKELPQEIGDLADKHIDKYLQTPFISKQLEKKSIAVTRDYKSAINETGANLLYLAIGFLEWTQADDSDRKFRAPLVLIPINIEKKRVNRPDKLYAFEVSFSTEYIEANLSLAEMLDRNFGFKLPEWGEETKPEEYFTKVAEVVSDKQDWSIHREMVIGFFSFAKLRIYKDLDESIWPEGSGPLDHPSVAELLVGRDQRDQPCLNFGEDINLDDSPEVDQIPLVMKADGSQLETIQNVLNGSDNVVVHGPPGTGKSQTIANLVAAALNQSKTVLFVSEKKAALDVVRKRLDSVNLGDFCLELHSHLTRKGQLHRDLDRRLRKQYREVYNYPQKVAERKHHRKRLIDYYDALIQKRGRIDLSAYEIFGEAEKWRTELSDISFEHEFENCLQLDQTEINVIAEEIKEYASLLADFDNDTIDAWTGFFPKTILPGDENKVRDALDYAFNDINSIASQVASAGLNQSFSIGAVSSLVKTNFEALPQIPNSWEQSLAPIFAQDEARQSIQTIISEVAEYSKLKKESDELFSDISSLSKEELADTFKAATQLQAEGFDLWTVRKLKAMKPTLTQLNQAIKNLQEVTTSISGFFPGFVLCLESCERICELSDHLEYLPPIIQLHAYPEHASQLARQYLDEATATSITITKQIEELSLSFSTTKLPSIGRVREIIDIFSEQPGFLGRLFSSQYKEAKRDYLALCKKNNKTKPAESIESLTQLVHTLELAKKFENNQNYTTVFGPLFKGIETEWDMLRELVISSRKIATLLGSDPSGKDFLRNYELNKESISRAAENTRIQKRELDSLLGHFLEHQNLKATALFDVEQRVEKTVKDAELWLPALTRLHDNNDIDVSGIKRASSKAIKSLELAQSLKRNQAQKELLGELFLGGNTDIHLLGEMNNWVVSLAEKQNCDEDILHWLLEDQTGVRITKLEGLTKAADTSLKSLSHNLGTIESLGDLDKNAWFRGCMDTCTLDNAGKKLALCIEKIPSLQRWSSYQNLKHKLASRGLSSIVNEIETKITSPAKASSLYKFAMFNSMARDLVRNNPEFRDFQGPVIEQVRGSLKKLEEELEQLSQSKIAWAASRHTPPIGISFGRVRDYTELSLIEHEIGKQRAHIPVRQLVKRSVRALQALKPCFMMSPMSVAQYLAPGSASFDLVIMDEASQLKLEDALGVVLRGKQAVIVGDPKQLPPTSFFDRYINIGNDGGTIADNAESILDVAQNCFPNSRLRWHYRSEDERLIAFSNAQFYGGELVVFPTPVKNGNDTGVFHHYIENSYSQKGKKGGVVNRQEATNVAEAIKKHFKRYSDLSLGVATFNVNQSELIQDELDRLCREDKWLEDKIKQWDDTPDSFFIKNLENVQGDERDVMFISTTYGPDKESGQVYQRFGPINSETGWRRLNVIVTRAKKQVHLFTSLRSSEIRITPGSQQGVIALKNYLEYLETGKIPEWGAVNPERGPDSSFEIAVVHALNQRGYKTAYQVGVAGFFIDIGVYHPDHEGEFLLGIECDGATYHSAKSVRDRDILRQSILESKGWNIHRIWSTDWFKGRDNEIVRVLQVLDKLVAATSVREKPATTKEDLKTDYKPEFVLESASHKEEIDELREALLEFRREKIEPRYSDLNITILSDEWIERFITSKPTTPGEFFIFPLELRDTIKGGTQYLGDILELIEDFV
nr:DUF4011 domain-containing protein [Pseudodesulfovibrio sp.]